MANTYTSAVFSNRVYIEKDPAMIVAEDCPQVVIYLTRREYDSENVMMGKQTRWNVYVDVWVYTYGMEADATPYNQRDTYLGYLETAVMSDRALTSKCEHLILNGGEFDSARLGGGVIVGGSMQVKATVQEILP